MRCSCLAHACSSVELPLFRLPVRLIPPIAFVECRAMVFCGAFAAVGGGHGEAGAPYQAIASPPGTTDLPE